MNNNLKEVLEQIIESYKADYADCWETWKHLDAKANGMVAMSGIFLSGLFAFNKSLTDALSSPCQKNLILVAIWLLGITVLLELLAVWIRTTGKRPSSEELETMLKHILNKNIENDDSMDTQAHTMVSDDAQIGIYTEHISDWKAAMIPIVKHLNIKAKFVFWGQVTLTGAIFSAVILMTSVFLK